MLYGVLPCTLHAQQVDCAAVPALSWSAGARQGWWVLQQMMTKTTSCLRPSRSSCTSRSVACTAMRGGLPGDRRHCVPGCCAFRPMRQSSGNTSPSWSNSITHEPSSACTACLAQEAQRAQHAVRRVDPTVNLAADAGAIRGPRC